MGVSLVTSFLTCLLLFSKHKKENETATNSPEEHLMKRIKVLENRIGRCEDFVKNANVCKPISENQEQSVEIVKENISKPKSKKNKEKYLSKEQQGEKTIQSQDVEFVALTVTDGQLSIALPSQVAYYRAWTSNGKIFYEFYSEKTAKAINNRNAIIEPFCEKDPTSVQVDKASAIETCQFGTLNSDYTLNTKTIIKFV